MQNIKKENTHMYQEIVEIPGLLRRLGSSWTQTIASFGDLHHFENANLPRRHAAVIGRGSSGNACTFFTYLYGIYRGRQPIELRPWLTLKTKNPDQDWSDSVVYAYSTSGESTDIIHAAEFTRRCGAHVVGITNADSADCTLGKHSDHLLRMQVGPENAIPATKTFVSQLVISAALAGLPIEKACPEIAQSVQAILDAGIAEELTRFISGARQCLWIARGPGYAAALDCALKLQETSGISSGTYSSAEFLHGPIGSTSQEDRVILFVDDTDSDSNLDTITAALINRKVPVVSFGSRGGKTILMHVEFPFDLPSDRWARAVVFAVVGQLCALHSALARGIHPDTPGGLKKVTRTM